MRCVVVANTLADLSETRATIFALFVNPYMQAPLASLVPDPLLPDHAHYIVRFIDSSIHIVGQWSISSDGDTSFGREGRDGQVIDWEGVRYDLGNIY